jgi:putative endonuclease
LFSKKLNKFYVGACSDLSRRFNEHNSGKSQFTYLGSAWHLFLQ